MTGLPPGEFSLISPGTKIPGQVSERETFIPGIAMSPDTKEK